MTREEIIAALKANLNRPVQVEFTDGTRVRIRPLTVDKEGFIHDLATQDDLVLWVPFEEVVSVTPEEPAAVGNPAALAPDPPQQAARGVSGDSEKHSKAEGHDEDLS